MRVVFYVLFVATVLLPWPFIAGACPAEFIGPCVSLQEKREEATVSSSRRESKNTMHELLRDVRGVGQMAISDAKYLLTSPFRIDGESALIVGGVAATIGGLMAADRSIQRAFQENRTDTSDNVANVFETMGFARTVLGANVALIGAGWLFREHEAGNRLMRTALVSLESQLFVEGIVGVTKFGVGRTRPGEEDGTHTFVPFDSFDTSFPSAHAARSFAVAAVFAEAYPQPVPVLAYTSAALISLSRIYQNRHFASDVVAGAALGFFIGKALSWRHKNPDFLHGMNIMPFVPTASSGLGLTVHGRF